VKTKILVVDDEETARISLADILRLEGYEVKAVASGEAAIESLEEDSYDLMLLDIKMPGMDGVEVMLQATEMAPDTLIILLTAYGSLETAVDALRHGAHDYLTKPASPHEILSSVASGLARRSENQRKRLLLGQLESSLQELKDVEGVSQASVVGRRVVTLPGDVMADMARREVWRGNDKVSLTPTEGKLLKVLLENQGRVMTHRELVFMVQGYEVTDWEAPEVLRPLVSRLRRKLSAFPGGGDWIVNVRGTGYVFDTGEQT